MSADSLLRLAFGGLAPGRVDGLFDRFRSADAIVAAVMRGRTDLPPGTAASLRRPASERIAQLATLDVAFAHPGTLDFPPRLLRYEHGPRFLFVNGAFADRPTIAIVGTRTCTRYGVTMARAYASEAVSIGWSVVSGLAKGIDAAAHEGALDGDGHTLAVLGSGIDVVYPRCNRDLHARILDAGGVVVSEFPPGIRPDRWRFPTRNRIIAALADVVLVVEAGETGGALITARIACEYGLPVWATPGDVGRPASTGTNLLIRDGAFPILDRDDLAAALELVTPLVDHR